MVEMGCGVTVLGIYSLVASLVIIVMGALLVNTDYCDEKSETDGCKDLTVETGGSLTEVHNKIVKVDLFNADNGETGRVTTAGSECPPCKVSVFTTLEIIALTLLVVGFVTNFGRLIRYVIKVIKKHKLKTAEAKLRQMAETRKQIRQEIEMERGNSSTADLTKPNEDDKVFKTVRSPSWEEAVTS